MVRSSKHLCTRKAYNECRCRSRPRLSPSNGHVRKENFKCSLWKTNSTKWKLIDVLAVRLGTARCNDCKLR